MGGTTSPLRHRNEGMTLIELMVTIAVMAILVVVTVPSFVGLINQNRVATQINGFVGDLQFARSEAIKRGQTVTVCASSNGTSCLGTAIWNTGWIVFWDPAGNKSMDAGDDVLRRQVGWAGTDTFTADNATAALSYNRDGFAMGLAGSGSGAVTFTLHTSPATASSSRCVMVNISGRQQLQTPNRANCL
ncbi:MAG TPA: Tfp pilus assembly protein FimT/FimU [Variovorax sp.]|nr:Tfp pilus assembly protein FimT/FimU [Variovorax sp.]